MRVERSLARVEGRRLLRNPALWLSFLPLGYWLRSAWTTDSGEDVFNLLVGYGVVIPGTVAAVLVGLAVMRARRCDAGELLATVPSGAEERTIGHAVSVLAVVAAAVAWVVVQLLVLRPGATLGRTADTIPAGIEIPRPTIAQLLQGPAALLAIGCLAVALARWIPTWAAMPVFAIAALMQLTWFGTWSGTEVGWLSWLWPLSRGWVNGSWVGCASESVICSVHLSGFDRVTPWWHLGYLLALACLFAVIGVARDRRDRRVALALAAGALSVAFFAVVQLVVYARYASLAAGW
jgi:hypothetical protein